MASSKKKSDAAMAQSGGEPPPLAPLPGLMQANNAETTVSTAPSHAPSAEQAPAAIEVPVGTGELTGDGSGLTLPDAIVGEDDVCRTEVEADVLPPPETPPSDDVLTMPADAIVVPVPQIEVTEVPLDAGQLHITVQPDGTELPFVTPEPTSNPTITTASRFRVWSRGTLEHDGVVYQPGQVVDLPEGIAAAIPCLERIDDKG